MNNDAAWWEKKTPRKTLNSPGSWSEKEGLLLTSVWEIKPGNGKLFRVNGACNLSVMARVECTFPAPRQLRRLDKVRGSVLPQPCCRHRSTKHREKVAGSMIMSFGNPNAVNCFLRGMGSGAKGGNRLEGSQEKPIAANETMGVLLIAAYTAVDCLFGPLLTM